jgi:hypothetical protein
MTGSAVELGSGAVQGQSDLGAGLVASLFDSAQDQFNSGFVVGHVRSKTTLVAHSGGHALIVNQAFQGVEHFCTHAQRFAEALGAHGHDHEFLQIQGVVGVCATVDDIHHRYGHGHGTTATEVAVQGQT